MYERFFMVEPSKHMTKPQYISGVKKVFGSHITKSDKPLELLFESFDGQHMDKMEWRLFVCLLTLVMQPGLSNEAFVKYCCIIYASSGSFDKESTDKLPLSAIKDIVCVPAMLAYRSELCEALDEAWSELLFSDFEALQASHNIAIGGAEDSVQLGLNLVHKLLTETVFARFLSTGTPFGFKDSRQWTSRLEDGYYHPDLLESIKRVRRGWRNDDEVELHFTCAHV